MKLVSSLFCSQLVIEKGRPFSLVIENRTLFRRLIEDIRLQQGGDIGKCVLSEDNHPLKMKDSVDLLDSFAPFEINTKIVMSVISDEFFERSVDGEHYNTTNRLLADIEKYIGELCFDLPFSVECRKLDMKSLVKAASVSIVDDHSCELEKIIDYMSIVSDFTKIKLFITVNMASFFDSDELDLFLKTISGRDFALLMIESFDRPLPSDLPKLIIDADLCEI